MQKRESDLHNIYKGVSPLHYNIVVCPCCHYAASNSVFSKTLSREATAQLSTALALLPSKDIDYCGQRDLSTVLSTFKLAIRSAQLRKVEPGELAGLILAAAWISREMDNSELESIYLKEALQHYLQAYEKCSSYIANLDDVKVAYLIGELNLRCGHPAEAVNWFSKVISHKNLGTNPTMGKMARNQWQMARELLKKPLLSETGNSKLPIDENKAIDEVKKINKTDKTKAPETPVLPKRSNTIKMGVDFYPDQLKWIQDIVNQGYSTSKILVSKDQVLRIILDVVMEKLERKLPEDFGNEEELKKRLMQMMSD